MRTYLYFSTVACLATSALLLSTSTPVSAESVGETVKTAVEEATKLTLPAGITAKDGLNTSMGVEKAFTGITLDAMSKTGFDNLVSYLVDSDRVKKSTDKSLGNLDGNNNKQLTDVIARLNDAWKSKYNASFVLDAAKVFTPEFLTIKTGEVNDPTLLVGRWPMPASLAAPEGGKLTAAEAEAAKTKYFGGESKLSKGRNVAIARIPAGHGMPGITASLLYEHVTGWHFDIPNTTTAQMLHDNLVSNLTWLDSHRELMPTDVTDGYRQVSHAVIAAIYGVDLQKLPTRTAIER